MLASTAAWAGIAVGETQGGEYDCTDLQSVELEFTPLADPGDLAVGDTLPVSVGIIAEDLDLGAVDEGTVESAEVKLQLYFGDADDPSEREGVELSGTLDELEDDTWWLTGEHTFTEPGEMVAYPGTVTITQYVSGGSEPLAAPEEDEEAAEEAEPDAAASPEADADDPSGGPEALDGSEDAQADEQRAPADTESGEPEEQVTECWPNGVPPVLGDFSIGEEDSAEPEVTTDGGVEWSGTWVCESDNPSLLDSFEGPGTAVVTLGEELVVGEEAELRAEEASFTNFPVRGDEAIAPGDLSAVLSVALSGSAAPVDSAEFTTSNLAEIAPDDTDISFETPEPVLITPEEPGEIEVDLGDLVLTTEFSGGTVTHTCSAGSDAPPASTKPADDSKLPVTGAALGGLIMTAVFAVLSGAAAIVLGRSRTTAAD